MAEYRLNTGYQLGKAIDYNTDVDTFETTFISGLTYVGRVSGSYSGGGTLADPNLRLYSPDGRLLAYNDDITQGVNRDAQISFRATSTANYEFAVAETGSNASGSYKMIISAGYASNNNDRVFGTNYNDAINGMAGNDNLQGGGGTDRLFGGTGADLLLGGNGTDLLRGDSGNDTLRGGQNGDRLMGGDGGDRLMGGTGPDVFDFDLATDSDAGGIDVIVAGDGAVAFEGVGVRGGDILDVSNIDANELVSGNQAFSYSTSKTAGTYYLATASGSTIFYGHTDNDGAADFAVVIADGAITAGQYSTDEFLL